MKSNSISKSIIFEGESKKIQIDSIQLYENKEKLIIKLKETNKSLKENTGKIRQISKLLLQQNLNKGQIDFLRNEQNSIESTQESKNKELEALILSIKKEEKNLKFKAIDINTKGSLIENETNKINKYSIFLILGVFLGFILSIYGFVNWVKTEKNYRNKI